VVDRGQGEWRQGIGKPVGKDSLWKWYLSRGLSDGKETAMQRVGRKVFQAQGVENAEWDGNKLGLFK
jgi:hypothetical protein